MKHAVVAVGFDGGFPFSTVCVCGMVFMRPETRSVTDMSEESIRAEVHRLSDTVQRHVARSERVMAYPETS